MDGVGNWADKCTLNCGSCLWGIPVKIHYTFFILWVIEVILAAAHYHLIQYTMVVFLLYGPVLLVTIIIHEFGHSLMNRRFGGHVDHILIWPLGGFAIIGPTGGNVLEDFWVAFAGPLTHVPQIVFWIIIYAFVSGFDFEEFDFLIRFYELDGGGAGPFFKVLSTQAVELNVLLIVFNLFIPAYPLDGGRCLAALLVHFGVAVLKAAYITAITAIVAAVGMIIYGLYTMIADGRGTGFFFILIAIFILISSINLFRMAKTGRVYEHPLFDRPCYRQRGGAAQSGGNTNNGSNNNNNKGTKKKKVIKKKEPAADDVWGNFGDIESPPQEGPMEPKASTKTTKKSSTKKAPPSDSTRQSSSTKQTSAKKTKPGETELTRQSTVKKSKPSEANQSVKQSSSKKAEPKSGETKKSTKKASTKTDNGENRKSEVKPATRKSNKNETTKIENEFDDIKKRYENRKTGIYEP